MAKNKIEIELSLTEARHVEAALAGEQADHQRRIGRANPALGRVQTKLTNAMTLAETAAAQPVEDKPNSEDSGDEETADAE